MEWQNGLSCAGSARAHRVVLLCDPTAIHPTTMVKVEELATCIYTTTIKTALVCNPPSYNSSEVLKSNAVVPYKQNIPGCNFGGYDFSPLSGYDIYVRFNDYLFINRVCGQVADPFCHGRSFNTNSSVCQIFTGCGGGNIGNQWLISSWNPHIAQYKYVNGKDWKQGVQITVRDGHNCDNGPRTIRWDFVCDPNAKYAYSVSAVEEAGQDYCHYDVTIMTDIVCQPPNITVTPNNSSSTIVTVPHTKRHMTRHTNGSHTLVPSLSMSILLFIASLLSLLFS
jgi:hypothetical protein